MMEQISTKNAPAAIGPYSQALDLGNLVFVSGQLPVDPATGTMPATVEEQAAPSHTEDGELYVSFWNSSGDYFLYTESEMDEYIQNQHGQQMGVM